MAPKIKMRMPEEKTRRLMQLILGFLFAVYNGAFGLIFRSAWHIEIAVYYALLLLIKGNVYAGLTFAKEQEASKKVFVATSVLLVLINLSLIFPIISMIRYERDVPFPLEVAIGIAAYTTYRVTVTVIDFVKMRKFCDLLTREAVTIRCVEAIVSVLTLQNTLITVNAGTGDDGLRILCIVSSAVGLIAILYLIVKMFIDYFKASKN